MPGTLSRCLRCGSTEVESRPVDEFVRRGAYVVALGFVADVCGRCGEKYLQRSDVSMIEDVRRRLDRGELGGFRVTGELLEPAGVTVIADGEPGAFETTPEEERELTAQQEAELAESIAEADRGDVITAAELLERLPR